MKYLPVSIFSMASIMPKPKCINSININTEIDCSCLIGLSTQEQFIKSAEILYLADIKYLKGEITKQKNTQIKSTVNKLINHPVFK